MVFRAESFANTQMPEHGINTEMSEHGINTEMSEHGINNDGRLLVTAATFQSCEM